MLSLEASSARNVKTMFLTRSLNNYRIRNHCHPNKTETYENNPKRLNSPSLAGRCTGRGRDPGSRRAAATLDAGGAGGTAQPGPLAELRVTPGEIG